MKETIKTFPLSDVISHFESEGKCRQVNPLEIKENLPAIERINQSNPLDKITLFDSFLLKERYLNKAGKMIAGSKACEVIKGGKRVLLPIALDFNSEEVLHLTQILLSCCCYTIEQKNSFVNILLEDFHNLYNGISKLVNSEDGTIHISATKVIQAFDGRTVTSISKAKLNSSEISALERLSKADKVTQGKDIARIKAVNELIPQRKIFMVALELLAKGENWRPSDK